MTGLMDAQYMGRIYIYISRMSQTNGHAIETVNVVETKFLQIHWLTLYCLQLGCMTVNAFDLVHNDCFGSKGSLIFVCVLRLCLWLMAFQMTIFELYIYTGHPKTIWTLRGRNRHIAEILFRFSGALTTNVLFLWAPNGYEIYTFFNFIHHGMQMRPGMWTTLF